MSPRKASLRVVGGAERLADLPVGRILRREDQPRQHFDESKLKSLAASIDADGQAVRAIVRPHPTRDGFYELVAGERRWRAVRDFCSTKSLRVVIVEPTDADAFRLSFVENENREDLHPLEKAEAMRVLVESGKTQRDVARMVGKDEMYVSSHLSLLRLHPEARALFEPSVPERDRLAFVAAVAISRLPYDLQPDVARFAAKRGIRVADVNAKIAHLLGASGADTGRRRGVHKGARTKLLSLCTHLARHFGDFEDVRRVYIFGHVPADTVEETLELIDEARERLGKLARWLRKARGSSEV